MQQREIVSGYSELKDLLIRTYKIERSRELVKLYFTENDNRLLMHDYDNHKNSVEISKKINAKLISSQLSYYAFRLALEALKNQSPSEYLNSGFKLNGFFRS